MQKAPLSNFEHSRKIIMCISPGEERGGGGGRMHLDKGDDVGDKVRGCVAAGAMVRQPVEHRGRAHQSTCLASHHPHHHPLSCLLESLQGCYCLIPRPCASIMTQLLTQVEQLCRLQLPGWNRSSVLSLGPDTGGLLLPASLPLRIDEHHLRRPEQSHTLRISRGKGSICCVTALEILVPTYFRDCLISAPAHHDAHLNQHGQSAQARAFDKKNSSQLGAGGLSTQCQKNDDRSRLQPLQRCTGPAHNRLFLGCRTDKRPQLPRHAGYIQCPTLCLRLNPAVCAD